VKRDVSGSSSGSTSRLNILSCEESEPTDDHDGDDDHDTTHTNDSSENKRRRSDRSSSSSSSSVAAAAALSSAAMGFTTATSSPFSAAELEDIRMISKSPGDSQLLPFHTDR